VRLRNGRVHRNLLKRASHGRAAESLAGTDATSALEAEEHSRWHL